MQPHSLTAVEAKSEEPPANTLQQDTLLQSVPFHKFDDDLFSPPGPNRPHLSHSQKRKAKCQFAQSHRSTRHALDLDPTELRNLQEKDDSLREVWEAASGSPSTAAGPGFFFRDGILMRQSCSTAGVTYEQVVVPASCRQDILKIAHKIPMGGHLGHNKTTQRILMHFYWPSLFRDVREYCRSCERCQKAGGRKSGKVPLISLPIMSVPFERIAMDIVGPLPKSNRGNRYILVICDYATRYPKAIALRSIAAEDIAEELAVLFSRVGIPNEILTDQGSNFTSKLLQELYKLLHVRQIRTSPYHPQTDGLVERFNQTLKSMLRKTATDEGKDWDKLLPYLLFAYREVPQDSTGFSPFELLYGRPVRGPLDVLKESWVASEKGDESVISHILNMREKLSKMVDLVETNLVKAQNRQKRWYDRSARDREFKVGDQVLVLLPTSTNKLLAQWQGPYVVKEKVGKVNYLVEMHDRRKRHRIFHVNMLKQWHMPVATAYLMTVTSLEVDEDDDVPVWDNTTTNDNQFTLEKQLSPSQRKDLTQLLNEYHVVMRTIPGRTSVIEHSIDTGSATPIRSPSYRIPHAYREAINKEIREMLEAGLIEPSLSNWSSPTVPITKKDGSLRLCVDYRKLNASSKRDALPNAPCGRCHRFTGWCQVHLYLRLDPWLLAGSDVGSRPTQDGRMWNMSISTFMASAVGEFS